MSGKPKGSRFRNLVSDATTLKSKTKISTNKLNSYDRNSLKDPSKAKQMASDPDVNALSNEVVNSKKKFVESNSTADELKDPNKHDSDVNKDLNDIKKGKKATRTKVGKDLDDDLDDPESPEAKKKERRKYLGILAGIGAFGFIAYCIDEAEKQSGCYLVKADGSKTQVCQQANCSTAPGGSCGAGGGRPNAEGKCCPSQTEKASPTDSCQCVTKEPWDVAGETLKDLGNTALDLAGAGFDLMAQLGRMMAWLAQNGPVLVIVVGALIFGPKLFEIYRGLFPKEQSITISAPSYAPPPTYAPPPVYMAPSQVYMAPVAPK